MNRLLGALHLVLAALVALYFMFGRLLPDPWDHQFWEYLNWGMGLACVLSMYFACRWKHALADDASTKDFITAKVLFGGAAILLMWFTQNVIIEWTTTDAASQSLAEHFWMFIDPLFVLVAGCVGYRLWGEG